MNDEMFADLIKSLIRDNEDLSLEFRGMLECALSDEYEAVWWSIDDIEWRANNLEEMYDKGILYDRKKFKDMLKCVCEWAGEDPDAGLTWNNIDAYLNDMCLLEGK
jgi:hypothetical protein